MDLERILPLLLAWAWLLPLASFALIVLFGPRMGKAGRGAGFLATLVIIASFILSAAALTLWLIGHPLPVEPISKGGQAPALPVSAITGDWYALGVFGSLRVTIGYYIDALTIAMFCMVTLVSSCIHVYSFGYMHEELHEVIDPLVTLPGGQALRRRGRFCRFFQYFSLFCFSMLGLVIAGNLAMVFVFWELVGICSYLLIGFYFERKTASNAANKAFIVNRVGDFGMMIGLAAIWTGMGTFSLGDYSVTDITGKTSTMPGIFSQVRPESNHYALRPADGMVKSAASDQVEKIVLGVQKELAKSTTPAPNHRNESEIQKEAESAIQAKIETWRQSDYGYWLLTIAGLGIFCGCVGKSAQFPLHVWLPDAMEGPTPVSALIHAATMVAAGVYLVGRFYPVFTPEVLLAIAVIGCITLFLAATMALTATDIKRVLAYSTVSQLGYMMFALGVGGWLSGLFHLFTHSFFKALLFLCSGSVIHACGTNEMPRMGGLLKKMPYTAWTMLAGCLAISGAGVPTVIGLSGYYSKDYIIAQALVFKTANPMYSWMFYLAVATAGMTSFYMFRLWFLTFVGKPRDERIYEHAHEAPRSMIVPLVVLAALSVVAGWNFVYTNFGLEPLLKQAIPAGTAGASAAGKVLSHVTVPAEHLYHPHSHEVHFTAAMIAFGTALAGFVLAAAFYGLRTLDPRDVRRTFAPFYSLFYHKWWFDELYQLIFVRPVLWLSRGAALFDRKGIDWAADNLARAVAACARLDDWIDRLFVDRFIDLAAGGTYAVGIWLRRVQTGNLRQYVMLLALGMIALFVVMNLYQNISVLGW
jgi:NADH:ubiquinone oxidoreductase subunit 5 (subunit L)/multisubunit Na+/H+ antiporter MnhA subunit